MQHELGNSVRIFEHVLIGIGRADRGHDPLAHARDDRLLGRAADESIEVGADRHARFHFHADAVLRHAIDRGAAHRRARDIDDFWINTRADGFEDGFAGAFGRQVDRAGAVEIERDAGFVRRDQREDDMADVAAREIMRLERIARDIDAGFHGGDPVIDDQADRHFAQAHADHLADADRRIRDPRAKPEAEEIKEHDREHEGEDRQHCDADEVERVHEGKLRERRKGGKRYLCPSAPQGSGERRPLACWSRRLAETNFLWRVLAQIGAFFSGRRLQKFAMAGRHRQQAGGLCSPEFLLRPRYENPSTGCGTYGSSSEAISLGESFTSSAATASSR